MEPKEAPRARDYLDSLMEADPTGRGCWVTGFMVQGGPKSAARMARLAGAALYAVGPDPNPLMLRRKLGMQFAAFEALVRAVLPTLPTLPGDRFTSRVERMLRAIARVDAQGSGVRTSFDPQRGESWRTSFGSRAFVDMGRLYEGEALARAASQGPWDVARPTEGTDANWHVTTPGDVAVLRSFGFGGTTDGQAQANARFVAWANPAMIEALISEVQFLRDLIWLAPIEQLFGSEHDGVLDA